MTWLLRRRHRQRRVVIAGKVREESCAFCFARVRRDSVHAVGSFVETLADLVSGLWFALHLHANGALNDVADHRAGMAVWRGGFARAVSHLHHLGLQPSAVQHRQSVCKHHSRRFPAANRCYTQNRRASARPLFPNIHRSLLIYYPRRKWASGEDPFTVFWLYHFFLLYDLDAETNHRLRSAASAGGCGNSRISPAVPGSA